MPGLIDKAVQSGSDNPEIYCKRVDRSYWVTGGYHLQATPHELAQTVSAIRTHSAPRSMLCVGVESGGVERFLAEELGILSVRFIGVKEPVHPAFEKNSAQLENIGVAKSNAKTFDLIVVMGGDFEAAKAFVREGTVVAVFETGIDAKRPGNRAVWHEHRRAQNVLLHTHERGVGVFMVRNLTAMGVTSASNNRNGADGEQAKEPAQAGNAAEPSQAQAEVRSEDGEHSGEGGEGDSPEPVQVKRRGRPKREALNA